MSAHRARVPREKPRSDRIWFRWYLSAVILAVTIAAVHVWTGIESGDAPTVLLAAVTALIAFATGPAPPVVVLVVDLAAGEPFLALALVPVVLARLASYLPPPSMYRETADTEALVRSVARLSPTLVAALSAHSERGVITTRSLVEAAAANRPSYWGAPEIVEDGEAWDGPLLRTPSTLWTQYAAEAAALAQLLVDRHEEIEVDLDLLAGSARMIPHALTCGATVTFVGLSDLERVTGLHIRQLIDDFVAEFGYEPEGRHVARRISVLEFLGPRGRVMHSRSAQHDFGFWRSLLGRLRGLLGPNRGHQRPSSLRQVKPSTSAAETPPAEAPSHSTSRDHRDSTSRTRESESGSPAVHTDGGTRREPASPLPQPPPRDGTNQDRIIRQLIRMRVTESALIGAVGSLVLAGAAGAAALLEPVHVRDSLVVDFGAGPVSAAAVVLTGLAVATRRWVLLAILIVGLPLLTAGAYVSVWLMATGVAIALVGTKLSILRLTAQPTGLWPRARRGDGSRSERQLWHTAAKASEVDEHGLAKQSLQKLAHGATAPALRAASQSALAVLHTGRGESELALQAAVVAGEIAPRAPDTPLATWALERSAFVLQHFGRAEEALCLLRRAAEGTSRGSGATDVRLRLIELLAEQGSPDEAMAEASQLRATGIRGALLRFLEVELTIATALLSTNPPAAGELLDEIAELIDEVDRARSKVFKEDIVSERSRTFNEDIISMSGWLHLNLGVLGLLENRPGPAVDKFERARARLTRPIDRARAARSTMWSGIAEVRSGGELPVAVRRIASGLETLEQQRGALRQSDWRVAALRADQRLYDAALDALHQAQQHGAPDAGETAWVLIESLRRSAIADTLRQGGTELPPVVRGLLDRIDLLLEQHGGGDLDGPMPRKDLDGRGRKASAGDTTNAIESALDEVRDELEAVLGEGFAAAYLPSAVTVTGLRDRVGDAHVVGYWLTSDRVEGWAVWASPSGAPQIHHVVAPSGEVAALLAELPRHPDELEHPALLDPLDEPETEVWRELAATLLPSGLLRLLAGQHEGEPFNLYVVPDGSIARVPWAALRDPRGRPIARSARIQILPAIEVLESTEVPRTDQVAALLDRADGVGQPLPGLKHELAQLKQCFPEVQFCADLDELRSALHGGAVTGTYLAAHGVGEGLTQYLTFDGVALSAAQALLIPWPPWVVLASCFAGGIKGQAGREPLGFPIACLLGGATSVIGGVIAIGGLATASIATGAASRIGLGVEPAEALRQAQLAYLDEHPDGEQASASDVFGMVCVGRQALTSPVSRGVRS